MSNCWDVNKCGREKDGENVAKLGECPAFSEGAGDACWLIAGTFCKGIVQGSFAEKQSSCTACDFYHEFDIAHRAAMRAKFRDHLRSNREETEMRRRYAETDISKRRAETEMRRRYAETAISKRRAEAASRKPREAGAMAYVIERSRKR